uniref:Uncharacterized protein n=1 Tax=Rhizophora mucronata TaxID=61149 RepID=A0A2P2QQI6_RHIMU
MCYGFLFSRLVKRGWWHVSMKACMLQLQKLGDPACVGYTISHKFPGTQRFHLRLLTSRLCSYIKLT